ncbi:MAG: ABC transporter ATP-binding protein [Acidimicrobiia bacterium]
MSYDGSRGIVDLDIPTGEEFGFLGPNGAGKTTTIRILLDLLRPTSGRASVLGLESVCDSLAIRARIGYLPGDLSLPAGLTGTEVLDWLSSLRPGTPPVRRDELVERFAVQVDRPMKHLSKGNRQKIGLVQAFQHAPEMVILDELTGGLDPLAQDEFHRFVREYVAGGGTVFLSSHSLDEVQHKADRVGIIRDGRVVTVETVDARRGRGLRRVSLTVRAGAGESAEARLQVTDEVADLQVSFVNSVGAVTGIVLLGIVFGWLVLAIGAVVFDRRDLAA